MTAISDQSAREQSRASDVLELIRSGSARTRAELISQTGLSRSTVSDRLSALLGSKLVVGVGQASSTGGRPATLLAFNEAAGVVVGAALGATAGRIGVVDLGGNVLGEREYDHLISDGPTATLERMEREVVDLLAELEVERKAFWGLALGVPGPVEFATGTPVSPPIMPGWDGFPVRDWVERHFSCPALVDNDVNIMTLGERTQFWRDSDPFVFIKVGSGIGAGVTADGVLFRGADGAAGDIGHIYVPGHDEIVCECGNHGCLEAVVGGRALAARLTREGLPTANAREVASHARSGNSAAIRAVREGGRELGGVLAGLVNSVNPSVLVIGGSLAGAGDHLLAGIREVIYRRSPPLATRNLRIVESSGRERAGVLGAAEMITTELLFGSLKPTGRLPS